MKATEYLYTVFLILAESFEFLLNQTHLKA